jgi:hypothetical protein
MRVEHRDRLAHLRTAARLIAILCCVGASAVTNLRAETDDDSAIAQSLAALLQAARGVISEKQGQINNPDIGDKGLTSTVVLAEALRRYPKIAGHEIPAMDGPSKQSRLLKAQMDSIVEVMDAYQEQINQPDVGFKGFIPATFARLVNEAFTRRVGTEAEIKITAPLELLRNIKALPDHWEAEAIRDLQSATWPKGQFYSTATTTKGRSAFRVVIPEYYARSCLTCHGDPKGQIDLTGFPKEGSKEGDLGAVISITLFR